MEALSTLKIRKDVGASYYSHVLYDCDGGAWYFFIIKFHQQKSFIKIKKHRIENINIPFLFHAKIFQEIPLEL
jgi:hypothetical protein